MKQSNKTSKDTTKDGKPVKPSQGKEQNKDSGKPKKPSQG